jgi:xanthine dehydrogenase YagS FAD-binding subunit
VALAVRFSGERVAAARVVLSGAAPIPWRSKDAEEAVTGKRLDGTTVAAAAQAALRGAQPLKHNGYKVDLFRGLIEEALLDLAAV